MIGLPKCRSCGAWILWARTFAGKSKIPLDAEPAAEKGNVVLTNRHLADGTVIVEMVPPGQGTHVSHYATCPQADEWRTRSKR